MELDRGKAHRHRGSQENPVPRPAHEALAETNTAPALLASSSGAKSSNVPSIEDSAPVTCVLGSTPNHAASPRTKSSTGNATSRPAPMAASAPRFRSAARLGSLEA